MHLLKMLHFAALLAWCGTLLYLPALIAAGARPADAVFRLRHGRIARLVFTAVASPAALLAIVSGTLLFIGTASLAPWLILKLSVVALMVVGHALCGVLILRIEAGGDERVRTWCVLMGGGLSLLVGAALWLVLAKPA